MITLEKKGGEEREKIVEKSSKPEIQAARVTRALYSIPRGVPKQRIEWHSRAPIGGGFKQQARHEREYGRPAGSFGEQVASAGTAGTTGLA